ncbi:MAG: S41 family peptidase [Eubacteriales bacterium]|nr:S41 family peptidase [Eubacteriales bacterium]
MNDMDDKAVERRKRRWPSFLAGAVCGALFAAAVYVYSTGFINIPFLGSIVIGGDPQKTVETASGSDAARAEINYGRVNLKLRMIQSILVQDYYYDEDAQAVEDGIFTGMMYGLTETDRYAAYYPAEEYAEQLNSTRGNYYGIGALISQDPETNTMTVEKVYAKSPAEEAGLLAGDILKRVNREDITYMDLSTVVDDYVKGEEGTYVNLTVERGGETVELQIKRGKVEIPSVYASLLSEEGGRKTGYIYVSGFEVATVGQFKEAVDAFIEEGAEGLVIDLRDNPGGVMDSALSMLDYLLADNIGAFSADEKTADKGKTLLLYTENKQGRADSFYASDKHEVKLPVTVLMNANSASASEIFAGVLKDYQKAEIVGTTSYGKGIVQTEFPLPDGSAIKYTSSQYFTPSGYAVHGQGVAPDVEIEASEEFLETGADPENPDPDADNQLAEAIRELYR